VRIPDRRLVGDRGRGEAPVQPAEPGVTALPKNLQFRVGLLLGLTLMVAVGFVVYVLYARGVFEARQRLTLVADNAEGVSIGMDLTFSGFPIGRVNRMALDEDGRARIDIDVPRKDARWLRSSSVFTIERGVVGSARIRAYTGNLQDPLLADGAIPEQPASSEASTVPTPRVTDILGRDGLIEPSPEGEADQQVGDLTREPLSFPADRDLRLQNLARADEGFLLALGYSTQRGYGRNHPFAGEIRFGEVEVEFFAEDAGFAVPLGEITLTECQMVNQFKGSATQAPCFTRGYGLAFGQSERKTMSMALVDRALRAGELGEEVLAPAQDEEFVMSHSDNVQSTGFVEHLKLPHYVDFQSELGLLRKLRQEFSEAERASGVREAAE